MIGGIRTMPTPFAITLGRVSVLNGKDIILGRELLVTNLMLNL
jgi:hypothetical protein